MSILSRLIDEFSLERDDYRIYLCGSCYCLERGGWKDFKNGKICGRCKSDMVYIAEGKNYTILKEWIPRAVEFAEELGLEFYKFSDSEKYLTHEPQKVLITPDNEMIIFKETEDILEEGFNIRKIGVVRGR